MLTITQSLEHDILSGALPPGTALSQTDLALRFGVSRIPVRDALAQLAAQGLITAHPNRTATVVRLTEDEIAEVFHMRTLLECDLLERAIGRMTPEHLDRIGLALERSAFEARQSNWAEGDSMFHAALYAAAESPRQQELTASLRRTCRVQIAGYSRLTGETGRWLTEHDAIAAACQTRKVKEAVRLLRRHLRAARDLLLREIRAGG